MSSGPAQSRDDANRTEEFLQLLGRHEERTKAFVFSLVPNWTDAQDIAQEVRLRLWEQFDAYDPAKDFGAWSRTIAYYQVLAYRKRLRNRRVQLSPECLEIVAAAFDVSADNFESRDRAMRKCLRKLTAAKRGLLLRCYSGRESVRQIADSIGRSFDAVRKSLFRTRNQLAECVQRELDGEER